MSEELKIGSYVRVRDTCYEPPRSSSRESFSFNAKSDAVKAKLIADGKVKAIRKPGRVQRNRVGRITCISDGLATIEFRGGRTEVADLRNCSATDEPGWAKGKRDDTQMELF